ncbi:MAG: SDR family NAD(P)-dependent oxidoreductase [Eubacteriales bacterium]|nr:SDR family NAD(P)-dependent oxidoreductase [Eubacteriales bacterium]
MSYVIITGASRGIGKALSYEYAKQGFDLILTCEKNIKILIQNANDIKEKYNKKVYAIKGNINREYLNEIVNSKEDIYMLINNASKANYNLLQDVTKDEYDDIINSNLTTVFENTKAVLPRLIHQKKGIILNITSIWGLIGASNEVIYSMTKGGVIAFTKALSKEIFESNIECFAIALGSVKTDMIKNYETKNTITIEEAASFISHTTRNHNYKTGEIVEYKIEI